MSVWGQRRVAEQILQILRDVPDASATHHFDRPFLTAYQIAIELNRRDPGLLAALGYATVGGLGTGEQNSLAQYVANQLSRNMHAGRLDEIEGGFISNWHLADMTFTDADVIVTSSLTRTQYTVSVYRLKPGIPD